MASEKEVETVIVGNYEEMESEGKPRDIKSKLLSFLWHGGSVYDAWFSCASNQVGFQNILILSSQDIFLHPKKGLFSIPCM